MKTFKQLLSEAKNKMVAQYTNKTGGKDLYFEIFQQPNGNLIYTIRNGAGMPMSASNIDSKGGHDQARKNIEKTVEKFKKGGDSAALQYLNSFLKGWKKETMKEDLEEESILETTGEDYEKAGFKEDFRSIAVDYILSENKVDEFRKELIKRAVMSYSDGKQDIRGVPVSKIIDAYASKKNFGGKVIDELSTSLGLPDGVLLGLAKEIKTELKNNFSPSSSSQTQAQRVNKYLKQKWVK